MPGERGEKGRQGESARNGQPRGRKRAEGSPRKNRVMGLAEEATVHTPNGQCTDQKKWDINAGETHTVASLGSARILPKDPDLAEQLWTLNKKIPSCSPSCW